MIAQWHGRSMRTAVGRVRVTVPLAERLPHGELVWSPLRLVVVATRQPRRYAALLRARRAEVAARKRAIIAAFNQRL